MCSFKNWNTIAAILLLLLSLWLLFFAIPLQIPTSERDEISPRFFPQVASIILGLLCLILFFKEFKNCKSSKRIHQIKRLGNQEFQVLGLVSILIAYGWSVPLIGFYISSALILIGLYVWLGLKNWLRITLICICCMIFIYLLFEKGLQVQLPRGFIY